mmetsp:Transcript_291/g.643  ORF Transcript_291/g.643 Transcript_291/m.643 type:complete len:604 (-) Transcript_291:145-1956(-)|eukprot:CAMPEP_0113320182 /NCGR_PEP_ID=MMETSP0010_2-20120614/14085_1 /TAXON_ID=216773 ORGANISM="Corethron hystrix, Strain 308" /NCGR_SAMPLE_ID=MMETSP0010_2 /ASSEMBLY_ACC=CAM_ASM_000155 /LENGTH=603 /DNA_ID=CAMNT_0000177897 /DNA_START=56 /DNA_END=1867 /DNA_ORIENTATION=+ /assembly_acc=CAM_ASM_000155
MAKNKNIKKRSNEVSSDRPSKKSAISEDADEGLASDDASEASGTDDPCLALIEEESGTAHPSAERVDRSAELLTKEKYADALEEATGVIETLPPLPVVARAALVRGRALLKQAAAAGDDGREDLYEAAWNAFGLSNRLNPYCEEAMKELEDVTKLMGELRPPEPPSEVAEADVDVLVVGAGAAGVGCALMLTQTFGLETSRVLLAERGAGAGESFRRWPAEMRFISPSFNQQGWTDSFDLNAVAHGTSPAYSIHSEHPTGKEYAKYLAAIVDTHGLEMRKLTEVTAVRAVGKQNPLFSVDLRSKAEDGKETTETLSARYVIWAAGEFQYPRLVQEGLVGSENCLHNSQVHSWAKLPGDDFIIIGGYESGVDAAVNLAKAGKKCKVLASTPCWCIKTADPSTELAPFTAGRLRDVMEPGFNPKPQLFAPLRVVSVTKVEKGGFNVSAAWSDTDEELAHAPLRDLSHMVPAETPGKPGSALVLHTPHPPVLCTGFEGSVAAAARHLFTFADENHPRRGCLGDAPLLTEDDESIATPGIFLVGPAVQHAEFSFCFVYKFRQRFAVVAKAICEGLGIDTKAAVAECRTNNMYLDDFNRCEDVCGEVC